MIQIAEKENLASSKTMTQIEKNSQTQLNVAKLKEFLDGQNKITTQQMRQLIERFRKIIQNEPCLVKVNYPVTIIGDIHGQYRDLLKILSIARAFEMNKNEKLVFLGDYVDRGVYGVQVITLLMHLKIQFPEQIFLLRGNHQSRILTGSYNFRQQCLFKYSQQIYQLFMETFDALPLACLLNNEYLCVHGGISSKFKKLEQLNQIHRFQQIPQKGLFTDIIWADPQAEKKSTINAMIQPSIERFNHERGCSVFFTKDYTKSFLKQNKLKCIIRGHEVFLEGYKQHFWKENSSTKIAPVITIFSAPNYGNCMSNLAAIMRINQHNKMQIRQIKQDLTKNKLFGRLQVFSWSLPQTILTTNKLFSHLMSKFCQYKVPELKNKSPQIQLHYFLQFAKKKNIKPHFRPSSEFHQISFAESQEQHMFDRTKAFEHDQFNRSLSQYQKMQNNH